MSATFEQLDELARAKLGLAVAIRRLDAAVDAICPEHAPVQHRDRKQPWCKACGRDALGNAVRLQP